VKHYHVNLAFVRTFDVVEVEDELAQHEGAVDDVEHDDHEQHVFVEQKLAAVTPQPESHVQRE